MNDTLTKKLASIAEEAPDADDIYTIENAKIENDGSTISLDVLKQSIDGYSR